MAAKELAAAKHTRERAVLNLHSIERDLKRLLEPADGGAVNVRRGKAKLFHYKEA